jgi:radical SAM superfamily enzyme YgiQ (UPF0313 family)
MTKKILLIRPANVYNYNNYPPLNLILLASSLKKAGFHPEIINSAFELELRSKLRDLLPDTLLVAITMLTPELPDALEIMKFIKQNSSVPIIVGGWHCTLFPEQMAASDLVDYVIPGEGEGHLVQIAGDLQNGEKRLPKVLLKEILDLNTLPLPDYTLDPHYERFISGYLTDTLSAYVRQPMRWLPYESSRGCPSECTFCINVVTHNTKYRKKDAKKVIYEVEQLVKKYQLTHVKFIDDNFFVDIRRVREICQGIIDLNLDITWDAECRCDYFNDRLLNDETLALAKQSGLIQLTLGIESGSLHTLSIMKKHITPEQAEFAVKKCNQYEIIARSSFMLEIPGERIEDILMTIKFINRMRKYAWFSCGIGTFRPYPKCELTTRLVQEGFLKEPSSLEDWTSPDIINMYTAAEYLRPWQVDGKFSVSAAYYLNMESSTRLGNHQIVKLSDKIKNMIFIGIAKLRNKMMFYRFTIDIQLYKQFLEGYYLRKGLAERDECYPLSKTQSKSK